MNAPPPATLRLAGIDIGTLTCRILIADLTPGYPLTELQSDRRILRLGEGVDRDKRLNDAAMDRVIACLKEWRSVIDRHRVSACAVVATSAVRDASNRQAFLDRVTYETGFDVEIITGADVPAITP